MDHVIPESLEDSPNELAELLTSYDLPPMFRINGFENWLPAHAHCNSKKSSRTFKMVPAYRPVFDHLIRTASAAKLTAEAVKCNGTKDKILAKLASAIESNQLSITDLTDFLALLGVEAQLVDTQGHGHSAFFRLENGYWMRRSEIASEGFCSCERTACVGHAEKVYCYFPSHLSAWVIGRRLYRRCYDEEIECPRCSLMHRRGYVGREGSCGSPYSDQMHQVDTQRAEA